MSATQERRVVGYLLEPHKAECHYFSEWCRDGAFPWCCPENAYLTPPNHKKRKSLYVFRCNDPGCPAKLGIRLTAMYRIYESALAHLRNTGKPKTKRSHP